MGDKTKLSDREGKDIFEEVLPQNLTPDQVMHEHRKHFPFPAVTIQNTWKWLVQTAVKNGRGTQRGGIRADFPTLRMNT